MQPTDPKTNADAAGSVDRRNLLRDALTALERLQAKLDAAEAARHEPIAVVGIACRLPGGLNTPEDYWKALVEGRDTVTEVPADRWEVDAYYNPDPSHPGTAYTKAGGFLDDVDLFEPALFGMSPREAAGVDPQQRLLLETAWETLERAGIAPDSLNGSRTGVFVGVTSTDYAQRIDVRDPARSDFYLATGTALNTAAGRISFTLGLQGPCMAIDTACSSSLVAIHTACQSLRDRESNLVLAGGVNVMLSPDPYVLISKWGMLSPDGRCRTFDAAANGFVRGEGCVMFVLERQSDAIANGHRVLALIPGSAVNQDGRSSGLTVPNGIAQQAVIRQALQSARVSAKQVSYVEAHGTGTTLGDPIEVDAIAAAYGEGRPASRSIEIGSVKSNIGHLEAASGAAGLAKLVLSLGNRQIPASLHVTKPSPAISWSTIPVRISTSLHVWQATDERRIGAVSSFGASGVNAHLLVQEAPGQAGRVPHPRSTYCLPLSARTPAALAKMAGLYARYLDSHQGVDLANVCFTAGVGRARLAERLAIHAQDRASMAAALRDVVSGANLSARGTVTGDGRTRIAFLFTGQGAQYAGMGRELYASEPVFRQIFDRCASVLDQELGCSLSDIVFNEADDQLDQTRYTQPALYAVEVALAELWRSWGVEPSVVIGHSVGEFAAAAIAGVIAIEDGARLIAARGRLMQELPAGGVMVAVHGDRRRIEQAVAAARGSVSLAARNAPDQLVLAGAEDAVSSVAAELEAQGMRIQKLQVSHAFHSSLMEPMIAGFRRIAAGIAHHAPRIPWISNLTGAQLDWAQWSWRMDEYWARHVREVVAFADGVSVLQSMKCRAFLEVGPHPVLLSMARLSLTGADQPAWVPSLKRGEAADRQVSAALAMLFANGAPVNWAAVYPDAGLASEPLPTYPFQRERFIIPPKPIGHTVAASPSGSGLIGSRTTVAGLDAVFERLVTASDPTWLADHVVSGQVIMPMTAYLGMCVAAAAKVYDSGSARAEDFEIQAPLVLRHGERRLLQTIVDERADSARVRVFSRDAGQSDSTWQLHVQCRVRPVEAGSIELPSELAQIRVPDNATEADLSGFYDALSSLGVMFGPAFRGLQSAVLGDGEAVGRISVATCGQGEGAPGAGLHPASLDACFQVAALVLRSVPGLGDRMYLPVGVGRYVLHGLQAGLDLVCHARLRSRGADARTVLIDLRIEDANGSLVATLQGLRCHRVTSALTSAGGDAIASLCYDVEWKEQSPSAIGTPAAGSKWLVFDDGTGLGARLATEAASRGVVPVLVHPGTSYRQGESGVIEMDASSPEDYARLLGSGPVAAIVYLWPLRIPTPRADQVPGDVQQFGTEGALRLLQAISPEAGGSPRLYVATAGSQSVDGSETIQVNQAPVAGFARVAATEKASLYVTHVDVDPEATAAASAHLLLEEVLAAGAETQVAWRKGQRYVARLTRLNSMVASGPDEPFRLAIRQKGTLENLKLESLQRREPGSGEVEIHVRASGLNFRDVLNALGMYPGDVPNLGSDCAGVIVAVGKDVRGFAVGDRVVAMAEGAFSSHVVTRWEFVAPLPPGLSFEQGAAVPTAYLTAEITLNLIGRMKKGDKVLIHSGAGGVGMAAITLARRAGAEVFATAGSPEKRALLQELGVSHALDSRSTSFADEVLRRTGGRGVDIVLNSLAGEMLDRSFDVVRAGGTFLEIGKRGLWSHERVRELGRDIHYHIVDCNDNARETPQLVGKIFARILGQIGAGELPALRCTTFMLQKATDAFRFMAQARHTGRVVFRHPFDLELPADAVGAGKTYLVTGALRGLGLQAARWLAQQGARQLLLVGRSSPESASQTQIDAIREAGAQVEILHADVGSADGLERIARALQELPQVGGVIHCAGVLDDGMIDGLAPSRFAAVMKPKADAAWRLHHMLQAQAQTPDFFVLYSSMSTVFGSPGQSNYVAANAFLDAFSAWRTAQGLPTLSIGWGAWSETGMAARGGAVTRAASRGLGGISNSQGLDVLGTLIRTAASGAIAVAPIDWKVVASTMGDAPPSPLFADLLAAASQIKAAGTGAGVGEPATASLRERLRAAAPNRRRNLLRDFVRAQTAQVLGLHDPLSLDCEEPLRNLGLDSLTAVELGNRLGSAAGRTFPATLTFDHPSVVALAGFLADEVYAAELAEASGGARDPSPDPLDDMTPEEVAGALARQLESLEKR